MGAFVVAALAVLGANAHAQRVYFDDSLHALVPPGYHGGVVNNIEVTAAFGDFDGDGDADLVQGRVVLLNDGSGAYQALRTGPAPSAFVYEGVRAWATGDLNGDGHTDLVSAGIESNAIYFGDGAAHFASVTGAPPLSSQDDGEDVKLADIDGDGDLDVLFALRARNSSGGPSPGRVLLWRNDGNGVFVDAQTQIAASPVDDPIAIALGDFDGDGDIDLFVVNTLSAGLLNQHRMLLNNGLGTFSDASSFIPPLSTGAQEISAQAVDLDGDGNVDVFIGGTYLHNVGAASFVDASSTIPLLPPYGIWADVGDVDGDGDLDIFVLRHGSNRVLLQQPGGVFTLAINSTPVSTGYFSRVLLQDVDGDGDLDAHVVRQGAGELLLNDGTGSFFETSPQPLLASALGGDLTHGDVDGDGDIDLYVVKEGQDRLFLNDGTGSFVDASVQLPVEAGWGTHAEFVDIDGDHDLDLLIGAYDYGGAPAPLLFTNNGLGFFTDATAQWTSPPPFMDPFATADVDGDGDIDLLAGAHGHPTQLFLNDGTGHLSPSPNAWPSSATGEFALAFADLDGDGDQDMVALGALLSIYTNNGAGAFQLTANTGIPQVTSIYVGIQLADFDGDGDIDLAVGAYNRNGGSGLRLFLNNGAAHFTSATTQLPFAEHPAASVTSGDVDGDGDVDLWFVDSATGAQGLFLNNGHAVFTDASDGMLVANTTTAALDLADVDGDGDPDALVATLFGGCFVLPNLTRHVVWRTFPRIGYPLGLEVHGEPGTGFALFGSLATAQIPFGAAGTLRIDRSQIVEQLHGTFDADGRALATRQIPADPALIGRSIYWQALDAHPRRLTNLETTTFVNL
jgi:hypothetical protein